MSALSRRALLASAAAFGATAAFAAPPGPSRTHWREQRALYPQGVASGDPQPDSVLLWTRRDGVTAPTPLRCEIALDRDFTQVVAAVRVTALPQSDGTVRVLAGGLTPATVYWYRFSDAQGGGSRIGRTLTAPADDDARPARFAFVSCQNANQGAQNAYRRMLYEDRRAAPGEQLGFVLHLGDFIYEIVWYPPDRPQGMYDRRLRDIVRYEHGEKHSDFHIPTTTADYRSVHKAYLADPDIQDARAWLPFVTMWDNHEFSWKGWQSLQQFDGPAFPAQTRKVAAMQAWYEFHPARVGKPLDAFPAPHVVDAPITQFDDNGLGTEPNNIAAIDCLTGYRAMRHGRHIELIITDQRSYRSQDPTGDDQSAAFSPKEFSQFMPEGIQIALDAGRGGPATLKSGSVEIPNFNRHAPPQTILGAKQKAWFKDRLVASRATWKIWGNTTGTLDMRADPQNLPADKPRWPFSGYAGFGGGDASAAYVERGEIYDLVKAHGITGFVTVAGDRHSFWAGLASNTLPPRGFDPVGIAFITGSISAPGMVEANEHKMALKDGAKPDPLRALFLSEPKGKTEATVNLTLKHGVKSALEYATRGDLGRAHAVSNPDNAPHVSFVDMGGHGYGVVKASAGALDTEFVCIPRPLERSTTDDGGPLRYRVVHRAKLWGKGERPVLEQTVLEGDVGLSI